MAKIRFLPARERVNQRSGELETKAAIVFVPAEVAGTKQSLHLTAAMVPSEEFVGNWNSSDRNNQQLLTEDRKYVMFFQDAAIEKDVSADDLAAALS